MAKAISAEVLGVRETKRALEQLPRRIIKKVLRAAVNKGGTVIAKAARRGAPAGANKLLKRAIVRKIKTFPNGAVVAVIGANSAVEGDEVTATGRTIRKVPARYIHLVEKGHAGARPAPANEFLEPALENNKAAAIAKIRTELEEGVAREARKLG